MEWQWILSAWWFYLVVGQLVLALIIYLRLVCSYNAYVRKELLLLSGTPSDGMTTTIKVDEGTRSSKEDEGKRSSKEDQGGRRMSIFDELPADEVNPFINSTWAFTHYEALKTACMAVTVFPLRMVLFLTVYTLANGWCALCTLGAKGPLDGPLAPWRKCLTRIPVKIALRAMLFILGYYWIPTKGKKATSKEAQMVVSNHICAIETLVLAHHYLPTPVAAIENFRTCLTRPPARVLQTITVNRASANSRQEVMAKIKAHVELAKQDASNPPVLLFPEGTTHNASAVLNFKIGAFTAGASIQPVVVRFPYSHNDPSWVYTGPHALMLFFRIATQFINHLQIEFLPVVTPNEEELATPKLLAAKIRHQMATALGVPCTFHGVDDVMLQVKALRAHEPANASALPVGAAGIRQFFSIEAATIQKHFQAFVRMDSNKSGSITLEDFMAAFEKAAGHALHPAQTTQFGSLFDLMDADGSGSIQFAEYLLGLALSKQGRAQREEVLQLAFCAFDKSGTGLICKADCSELLRRVFPSMSQVQLNEMFAAMDTSKSGKVDFEEFQTYSQAHPELLALFQDNFYANGVRRSLIPQKKQGKRKAAAGDKKGPIAYQTLQE